MMLSPKMQRSIRVNDGQLISLSDRAQYDHVQAGYLQKRSCDNTKWHLRWFILYQNLLFYYESENQTRPTGVLLLEGSFCERICKGPMERNSTFCFTITYRRETQRQYELRAASEVDCTHWVNAIREASFNKLLLQKEELDQKQLHLLQVVESERTARWQYAQQCDELANELTKLRTELCTYKKEHEPLVRTCSSSSSSPTNTPEVDPMELRKIKKVQSFFRGWLCRRRWKQIVDQYIKSPHAESMRKRNSLVFKMVEAEEEYLEQLEILVTCFLRPFKMAASSKKPPCTHEDVNSIFLNSETVLFLHQIFFKGLTSRMESWPTLVLGDLFDMLLPMLTIYQEYVRNHHYSLQVLTECKQSQPFAQLLARLESKSACQGRSLETFLTYPMHQIPRYIITLHELLAHTPHDHVERRALQHARARLEELSRQMHDEVSETENLRKNLEVERMIIEGCDILLDVNQVFIRQGVLSQVMGKGRRATLVSRQTYLFSNHLLLATRAAAGRLHLPPSGRLPLHDALLIEDPSGRDDEEPASVCSSPGGDIYQGKDFKILVEVKGEQICAHLVAGTVEEKAAWTSELAQCMESAALTELLRACSACGQNSASLPACRADRALFTDDVDIRFSRTLNSCKVPQIRSATPQRLLQRLTDLRFLSVDFLNSFLLTYRVFTDGVTVLEALKTVFYEQSQQELEPPQPMLGDRKTSGASSVSGYGSEYSNERDCQSKHWRTSRKSEDEDKLSPFLTPPSRRTSTASNKSTEDTCHLTIPKIMATSSSNETLKGTSPSSPGATSSKTLVGSPKRQSPETTPAHKPIIKDNRAALTKDESLELVDQSDEDVKYKEEEQEKHKFKSDDKFKISQRFTEVCNRVRNFGDSPRRLQPSTDTAAELRRKSDGTRLPTAIVTVEEPRRASDLGPGRYGPRRSVSERRYTNASINSDRRRSHWGNSEPRSSVTSQISQAAQSYRRETSQPKAGVVITSFRQSHRRSSTSTAAAAFAIATSASSNPRSPPATSPQQQARRDSVISTAATMRVLNVLRHWISKHSSDFWTDERLRGLTMDFLKEIENSPGLLPAEHKAAAQLVRLLERAPDQKVDLEALFSCPWTPTKESIETLSALEVAEQMTYLDYQIFCSIRSEEFLGQAWTKADKAERAPHIQMLTTHFNHISNLVISEILKKNSMAGRVLIMEKWIAVADIARCLHNYNGVLQVCAALSNTSVYRLKKTWDKVSRTTKATYDRLQAIISSECRFRVLRDALHKCDPPCIPYLGMYLSDLSFIEEGTPNYTPDGLLNFSKMRMIAHVIREIRNFQQTPYKIDHIPKVTSFLLDRALVIAEEQQYMLSLQLEPRAARGSVGAGAGLPVRKTLLKTRCTDIYDGQYQESALALAVVCLRPPSGGDARLSPPSLR